jgi:hypothetical protein
MATVNVYQNSKHLLMSCRDKHVIAWKSFEIGDGILYTEDDVKHHNADQHPSFFYVKFCTDL